MSGWLEGGVALVTGGGSGLGLAIVQRFVEEGARVGVLEKSPAKVDELRSTFGEDVVAVVGDVSKPEANREAVSAVVDAFGRLDTLVANAGIWDGNVTLMSLEDAAIPALFDEVMGVNLKGALLSARAAAAELQRSEGSIIFTISNAGFYPAGGGPVYTASKHGMVGLLHELAYELAPAVRVNGVAPGAIPDTDLRGPETLNLDGAPIWSMFPADQIPEIAKQWVPLGFFPTSNDYTGAYTFLASKQNSRNVTGVVINCDGGLGVRGMGGG